MIFQLAEEKKLRLADTLDKFFPQIPNAARITIGQILTHRSGIHDIEADGSFGKQPRTREEVVARIAQGQPDFEPDAMHRYSNAGYILLGYIVEKAGGKPYQEALKERITSRIGLKDTYAGAGNTDPSKNEALSYIYIGGWKEAAELEFSVVAGAGSILSTPTDMTKFIQALYDLKLVSQDNLKRMTTMREDEGMGMEAFKFAGKTLYGHTGGSANSGAWLAYFPDEKLALAYTTNAKIYPVRDIVKGVFDIYWNQPFQIPTLDAFEVSPEVLERYVGVYSIPGTPMRVKFIRDGATLYFQPGGQGQAVPIEATAENKFKIDPFVVFEFAAAKGELTITRAGQKRIFAKQE
jgi:D-alanyl-D-alanine carboxypeptidase